jgi:hypothetical protein
MDIELVMFGRWEFLNDEQQQKAIKHGKPFGVTADFRRLANASGNTTRAISSATEFSSTLREALEPAAARLTGLAVLCHSDGENLLISGKLNADPVLFIPVQSITPWKVRTVLRPTIAAVKNKISPDARIILYGCHTGTHDVPSNLLEAFATSFELTCYGFRRGLQVCVDIDPTRTTVTDRGWIRIDDGQRPRANTCEAAGFTRDLRDLKPCGTSFCALVIRNFYTCAADSEMSFPSEQSHLTIDCGARYLTTPCMYYVNS